MKKKDKHSDTKLNPIHEPRYDPSETFLTLDVLEKAAEIEKKEKEKNKKKK